MGWTYTTKQRGQSIKAFFAAQFDCDNEHGTWKVLDCSSSLNVAFMAVEKTTKATGDREVFGLVCHIQHAPNDYYNFGYKDVTECMGPYQTECPARILDLLTPTTNEYALEWRAACRKHVARLAARPGVKKGDTVQFNNPIRFTSGAEHDTLVWVGGSTFRADINGWAQYYCVRSWRKRGYQVAKKAA